MESKPALLLVVHAWGGGIIHFARLLRDHLADRVNVVFAWGVEDRTFHISARDPEMPDQSFDLARGLDAPIAALHACGVRRANILCVIGLERHIDQLLGRFGVPFDVTFLSYELLAPNPHLMDQHGCFIGELAVSSMIKSIHQSNATRPLLHKADRRIACSRDLAWRASRFLPGQPILPARPPERCDPGRIVPLSVPLRSGEPLRVVVLGRLAAHKGLATIAEVARIADTQNFPIEITCLGESQVATSELPAAACLRFLGRYAVEEIEDIVGALRPHVAWLPFCVPETHSFVLSEVMAMGLPVLATGIGAVPERVEGRAATWLLPFEEATPERFFRCFEQLFRDRLSTPPRWMPTAHLPPLVPDFYEGHYLAPLCDPEAE